MSERLLDVLRVRLFRGGREVLRGVTFHARPGEIVALMGPSGSGKTSILRVIAGLEPFHSGSVQIGDVALDGQSTTTPRALRVLRRKIGMVFQFHHLFEHLTVLKNVCLAPVHAHGIPFGQAQERAWRLLAALGVEHRAHALPRELSGGEAQRVAIARALAVDPPLLLRDEPTAALDAARRAELHDLLRGLVRDGHTLVIATHDQEFADTCAPRVLYVHNGRLGAAEDARGADDSGGDL